MRQVYGRDVSDSIRAVSETTVRAARGGWRQPAATVALAVLGVATVYGAAVALGVISIGDEPGEDAVGAGAVRLAGVLALLVGGVVAATSVRVPESLTRTLRLLLPLAGASVVVATAYGFDAYFAPDEIRYVDRTFPSTAWLAVVVVGATAAAVLTRIDARVGLAGTTLVLLVCLFTLLFTGAGH
jgi:hypothetical protein